MILSYNNSKDTKSIGGKYMKKIITATILTLTLIATAFASDNGKIVRRIKIRSADPAYIAMMLRGHQNFNLPPELSTVNKSGNNSNSSGGGNQSGSGFNGPGGNGGGKGQ